MPKWTAGELAAAEAYGAEMLRVGTELAPTLQRYTLLHIQAAKHGDTDALRAARIAESRSWRRVLDSLPEEPSPIFAATRARALRWTGALAMLGDAIAAAIEANDLRALEAAHRELPEAVALGDEVTAAILWDVERVRAEQ